MEASFTAEHVCENKPSKPANGARIGRIRGLLMNRISTDCFELRISYNELHLSQIDVEVRSTLVEVVKENGQAEW